MSSMFRAVSLRCRASSHCGVSSTWPLRASHCSPQQNHSSCFLCRRVRRMTRINSSAVNGFFKTAEGLSSNMRNRADGAVSLRCENDGTVKLLVNPFRCIDAIAVSFELKVHDNEQMADVPSRLSRLHRPFSRLCRFQGPARSECP